MSYNFGCFNDNEFERFTRDILNFQFQLDLQDFKTGKDQGRDLRYSTPTNNNALVVQAKQYTKSGYAAFYRNLVNKELPKIKLLQPDRYMVSTSLSLSAKQKDDICKALHPYILTPNDIFGSEDLNKYLDKFPDLEIKWNKLWLSSTNVMKRVLDNATFGRSEFLEYKIQKTIQLYVHSKSYDDAYNIIGQNKYILITGQPGVGKTTLAHLLAYHYLANDFQLVYIDTDVKDAESLFDPKRRQIFFFDDFLGANYLEMINPKTTESGFVSFVERVVNSENKYLILTTRTTIFQNALEKYEKLRRNRLDLVRKEISLGNYSEVDKAKIFYNHIFHSELSEEQRTDIYKNKRYWEIINHRNYNPRLIDFITNIKNVSTSFPSYFQFALHTLNNPEEVWKHAYEQQFTPEERILVNAVFSLNGDASFDDTKVVFDNLLGYQIKRHNHVPSMNPFGSSCKKLLDGILIREAHWYASKESIHFVNPSLNDFLINYFIKNGESKWDLFNASTHIEQFERYTINFFNYFQNDKSGYREEGSRFIQFVMKQMAGLQCFTTLKYEKDREMYIRLRTCKLLNSFYEMDTETADALELLTDQVIRSYPIENISFESRDYYLYIITYATYAPAGNFVRDNWDSIIENLTDCCVQEEDFEEITKLFNEYDVEYRTFLRNPDNYDVIERNLSETINEATADWIRDEQDSVLSDEDFEDLKISIRKKRERLFDKYGIEDESFDVDYFFPPDKMENTIIRNREHAEYLQSQPPFEMKGKTDNDASDSKQLIDDLFSGLSAFEKYPSIVE